MGQNVLTHSLAILGWFFLVMCWGWLQKTNAKLITWQTVPTVHTNVVFCCRCQSCKCWYIQQLSKWQGQYQFGGQHTVCVTTKLDLQYFIYPKARYKSPTLDGHFQKLFHSRNLPVKTMIYIISDTSPWIKVGICTLSDNLIYQLKTSCE
jgi:hypothetical protein